MNAKKTRDGYTLAKDFTFLGRSGIKEINGLRIAYLSGIDIDQITIPTQTSDDYLGNYFNL